MLLRVAAGGQQLPVQACQFGTAGVIVFIQPVGQDQPAVFRLGVGDDGVQKAVELGSHDRLLVGGDQTRRAASPHLHHVPVSL